MLPNELITARQRLIKTVKQLSRTRFRTRRSRRFLEISRKDLGDIDFKIRSALGKLAVEFYPPAHELVALYDARERLWEQHDQKVDKCETREVELEQGEFELEEVQAYFLELLENIDSERLSSDGDKQEQKSNGTIGHRANRGPYRSPSGTADSADRCKTIPPESPAGSPRSAAVEGYEVRVRDLNMARESLADLLFRHSEIIQQEKIRNWQNAPSTSSYTEQWSQFDAEWVAGLEDHRVAEEAFRDFQREHPGATVIPSPNSSNIPDDYVFPDKPSVSEELRRATRQLQLPAEPPPLNTLGRVNKWFRSLVKDSLGDRMPFGVWLPKQITLKQPDQLSLGETEYLDELLELGTNDDQ
ncbi:MAG: hypothetical protein M1815_004494, partial [Lichina confinis]